LEKFTYRATGAIPSGTCISIGEFLLLKNMETQINMEELELVKAIQVIKKYHEKEAGGQKVFDQNVWTLIDALIKTTTQKYKCPTCGATLKLYLIY